MGFLNSHLLYHVIRFSNSRSIRQYQRKTVNGGAFLNGIPGGSGNIRYNGSVFSQQRIHQGGFPHVRLSNNGYANPFFRNSTVIACIQKILHLFLHFAQIFTEPLGFHLLDIFIRKINIHSHLSQHIPQTFPNFGNLRTEAPLQLTLGNLQRHFALCFYHIDDRLRLGEIHPAVEKCKLREFARLRHASTAVQHRPQNQPNGNDAAVCLNFHHIFTSVRMRGLHVQADGFIDDILVFRIHDIPVISIARLHLRRAGTENFFHDVQ